MIMRVVEIGSGLSGLTFAALLTKEGHSVIVYEQYKEIGGVSALILSKASEIESSKFFPNFCTKTTLSSFKTSCSFSLPNSLPFFSLTINLSVSYFINYIQTKFCSSPIDCFK